MRSSMFTFKLPSGQTREKCQDALAKTLCEYLPGIGLVSSVDLSNGDGEMLIFSGPSITGTLRFYSKELLFALNVDATASYQDYSAKFHNHSMVKLRELLQESLEIKEIERIPLIKRNNPVPLYFMSSDDRLLEYDFDEIKFHDQSKFQDIKILHSPSLGNTLILDELQNLAEADISYTQGLMNYGKNSYKDKEILILGGGDGGLLHELLKENPKEVIMVDIDGVVMRECRKYLRGACGSCLDTFDGPNYKIIVDDCLVWLDKFLKEGRKFDYVFNDLTDIPISVDSKDNKEADSEHQKECWHFVRQILDLSLPLLRDSSGKYLNHAIGVGCRSALAEYEALLKQYNVQFSRHTAFVPSFMEDWVFYEIWKM